MSDLPLFTFAADAPLRRLLRRYRANPRIYSRRLIQARARLLMEELAQ